MNDPGEDAADARERAGGGFFFFAHGCFSLRARALGNQQDVEVRSASLAAPAKPTSLQRLKEDIMWLSNRVSNKCNK